MGWCSPKKELSDSDPNSTFVPRGSKRSKTGKAPRCFISEQAHLARVTRCEPRCYQDVGYIPEEQAKTWLKAMKAKLSSMN